LPAAKAGPAPQGFPLDGTYFSACAGEGAASAEGALEARLTFPEICFDGAVATCRTPRGCGDCRTSSSMTGPARAGADAFDARIFFGAGPDATSIVIVLRDRAATLSTCLPEPPLDDA
jgi:hypothetical protein